MRDENIIALRPSLSLDKRELTPIEKFQNDTLRPILKLQHALLVSAFQTHTVLRRQNFSIMDLKDKHIFIERSLKSDLHFKYRLIGMILGHFTLAEYTFFEANETELIRRITDLLVQRLQSHFSA